MPARYSVLLNKPDFLQSATRSVLLNKLVNVLKKKKRNSTFQTSMQTFWNTVIIGEIFKKILRRHYIHLLRYKPGSDF